MSEKSESEDFEEDDADESAGDDGDLDTLIRDVEKQRRKAPKGAEPTWRRLERVMEEKRTADLLSDLGDYDIESDEDTEAQKGARKKKKPPAEI